MYVEECVLKKDVYDFEVDALHYSNIESAILSHYNLGFQNSSSLPYNLSENDSGDYFITGTRASLRFYLDIKKKDSGKYNLTCYPE